MIILSFLDNEHSRSAYDERFSRDHAFETNLLFFISNLIKLAVFDHTYIQTEKD